VLPLMVRRLLTEARPHLARLDAAIARCEVEIKSHVKGNAVAKRLTAITGVGPLTAAAVIATVTDARDFKNGRQFAAWQGVVPRQDSSGGHTRLGHITKRGDTYLRGLLTQGARSALQAALTKEPLRRTRLQAWIVQLHARVGYYKTLVAIANKHARMIWAILAKGEDYDPEAWRRWSRSAPATSSVTP
jgi:transposase